MKIIQLLEYNQLFDDAPKDYEDYFRGIEKVDLIKTLSFLLNYSLLENKDFDSREFLSMFFCAENNVFANDIYKRIKILSKGKVHIAVPNPQSIYTLLEVALSLKDGDLKSNKSKSEVEIDIFKSCILANQNIIKKENTFLKWADVSLKDSEDYKPALLLINQLPYSEFTNYNYSKVALAQTLKSVYFLNYFKNNAPTHFNKFLEKYSVKTWQEFLKETSGNIIFLSKHNTSTNPLIEVNPDDPEFEKRCKLLEMFTLQNIDVLEENTDFRKLREKPLYSIKKGEYLVISKIFFAEKLFKSLYFEFNEINDLLPKADKIKNFKSFLCDEFSEKNIFCDVLNNSFGVNKYTVKISGSDFKKMGLIDSEPDYYVRKRNKVFLFESKDIMINAKIKCSYDYNLITETFREKLYTTSKKKKAVIQLTNNIRRILNKELIDSNYNKNKVWIYPVLVLHERMFSLDSLNYFVNKWFQEELIKLKNEGFNIAKIKELVIIDIDTFLFYQGNFRNGKMHLDALIDNYIKEKTHSDTLESFISFSERIFDKRKNNLGITKEKLKAIFN